MDTLYRLVMCVVKLYRFLHLLLLKLYRGKVIRVQKRLFEKIGVQVEFGEKTREQLKEGKYANSGQENKAKPLMTIHDERAFEIMANERSLGLAESYIDGLWDCDQLAQFFHLTFIHQLRNFGFHRLEQLAHYLQFGLFNLQTTKRAYEVAKEHYDLGDSLFKSFLDPSMTYTCGYWKNANNLEEAQQHKLDLIARKLKLKPGMRVLELGCGWGGLAHFLAKNYGVSVVACNIAKEGCKAAAKRCQGLPVKVLCCDYREINEKFDRVVAVGLMEHVGPSNYKEFFQVAHRNLHENGLFLVHTIGVDNNNDLRDDPFLSTYIFPNGALPRATEVTNEISGIFTLEDWHNFGNDYSKTLMEWYNKFVENWETIRENHENPTKFFRMWTYYLLLSAGAFTSRKIHLWQIVLSKNGVMGGYDSER